MTNQVAWHVVKTHDHWLSVEHITIINQLAHTFSIPDEIYEACYTPLLQLFAECVQSLPLVVRGQSTSMLNLAIKRVQAVMTINKRVLKKQSEDRKARMMYAVFSSALLFEVGRVILGRACFLGDDEGHHIRLWDPLVENMTDIAKRYKIRTIEDMGRSYLATITPIIATRLMPKIGLAWLNEDPKLMVAWHQALLRLEDAFEDWGLIYDLREIHEFMQQFQLHEVEDQVMVNHLEAGEAFWHWLQQGLNQGDLMLNQDQIGLYVIDGSLVIHHEKAFQHFCATHSQYGHWAHVAQQFKQLGIVGQTTQVYSEKTRQRSSGFYQQSNKAAEKASIVGLYVMQSDQYFKSSLLNQSANMQAKVASEGKQTTRILTAILGDMDQKFLPPKT